MTLNHYDYLTAKSTLVSHFILSHFGGIVWFDKIAVASKDLGLLSQLRKTNFKLKSHEPEHNSNNLSNPVWNPIKWKGCLLDNSEMCGSAVSGIGGPNSIFCCHCCHVQRHWNQPPCLLCTGTNAIKHVWCNLQYQKPKNQHFWWLINQTSKFSCNLCHFQ